jgi:syntaxin 18
MTDRTPEFDGILKENGAPTTGRARGLERVDEFLKEAHQIVPFLYSYMFDPRANTQPGQSSKIQLLHAQLRHVRQAYLSTAAPRKTPRMLKTAGPGARPPPLYLTDRQREEIDANAKAGIRNLNAQIRTLAEAEEIRQHTEAQLLATKSRRGLGGALGKWAAGGGGAGNRSHNSAEDAAAEEASRQLGAHRESVLWYLRQKLQALGALQQRMMETRLTREMDKNRSVLAKARGGSLMSSGLPPAFSETPFPGGGIPGLSLSVEEEERKKRNLQVDLTAEEVQMFEKGNHAMLTYYQGTLDKVR